MQVLFVDTPECTPVGPERCARCPLTGVAMDLTATITIVILCPFAHPVGNRGMAWMTTTITLPFLRQEQHAPRRHVVSNKIVAGVPVRMVTDPPARLCRVTRDDTDDRGTIIGIRTVPLAFIRAPAWRIRGVAMRRTFFPRPSGQIGRAHV